MLVSRRSMVTRTTAAAGSIAGLGLLASSSKASQSKGRKFTIDLRVSSIGIKADLHEAIRLANEHAFESVNPVPFAIEKMVEAERIELREQLADKSLVWGAASLPVEFRKDETTFQEGLRNLPKLANALKQAGVTRLGTWLRPYHDELTYVTNFRQHARRLRQCAKILRDHGQRFGLEYVGPKTLWASRRHSFIHSMRETQELIAEIGVDNVGIVLDSWHWYTAHETVEDLHSLSNKDVVACDLNDAPKGLEIDEQIDNQRELPMATGVIDLKAFLKALVTIDYDGPVRAEPFNKALNQMDSETAVAATAKAIRKAFALLDEV